MNDDASRERAARVKAAARTAGFDAVGICDLRPVERTALRDWLARGYAGSMRYLHRQAARRQQPQRIVTGARRAIVVLKNYYQGAHPAPASTAQIARYAWGEDYHRVLGEQLADLATALIALGSTPEHTRCYVDAGPVPERELAQRAGLGWIAKNTMHIHPQRGSFTFIGTVFTDLVLEVDVPFDTDHCGTCRRCLDACPTAAFPAPYVLDATKCISYLTIEQRGPFEAHQGTMIGDWLFGCDICQDVCPWNVRFAPLTDEPRFAARPEVVHPDLQELAHLDPEEFQQRYGDTAFERPGVTGLARNATQVLKNSPQPKAKP